MLMPIWVFMIMSEGMMQVRCAPKLGHVLFDPLSYEAKKFQRALNGDSKRNEPNENESITPLPVLNTTKITERESTIVPLTAPPTYYDKRITSLDTINIYKNLDSDTIKQLLFSTFLRNQKEGNQLNFKNCTVNPYRILCGYDKNIGISNYDEVVDLGKGCRLHNDRIECHYLQPPFVNLRRPPPNDYETNSTQLRAAIEIGNVEFCSNCSTKDPNEAVPSEIVKHMKEASKPNSKYSLKFNGLLQTTDLYPERSTRQESDDSSAEFLTPIPHAIHPKLKKSIEEHIEPKSTPAQNSVTWSQLAAETMPRIREINEIKNKDPLESDNAQLDSEVNLAKIEETKKSNPLSVIFGDGNKVPESQLVAPTKQSDILYVDEENGKLGHSPKTAHVEPNGPNYTSDLKYRIPRSAGRTPKIVQIQTSVTRKKRWCVEKGDRIVCYYSNYS